MKLFKICYTVMTIGLLVSPCTWGAQAVERSVPPPLAPQLSIDGNTLNYGAQPVIMVDRPKPVGELMRIVPPSDLRGLAETATANFTITYIAAGGTDLWGQSCLTFPESAKTAFDAAAVIWGNLLQSSVPITINACWASLGGSTLGYSGGGSFSRNFTGAPKLNTWYSASLANALSGTDLVPTNADMHITYNNNFSWYYGTDGNPALSQHDLMSVILHEIGHGLNFAGLASYSGGQGSLGSSGSFGIYDTFMRDGAGNLLTSYTSPSGSLGSVLTGGNIWFHGTYAMAANGGGRVKMYAPSTWADGSSYSHLDYDTFNNTENQLMVYAISRGEAIHDPGAVAKGLLKDLGWATPTGDPPSEATLMSPSGTIIATTPTYTWNAVSSSTWYYLWVNDSVGTKIQTWYTAAQAGCASGTGTCSVTPAIELALGGAQWWIQTWNSYGYGPWSSGMSFTVLTPGPPPAATLVSPSGTIPTPTPTYTWNAVPSSTWYYLWVNDSVGTKIQTWYTAAQAGCGPVALAPAPSRPRSSWRRAARNGGSRRGTVTATAPGAAA